jgi:omega-6 fatty acid desaturase (delta-12 desaturase)
VHIALWVVVFIFAPGIFLFTFIIPLAIGAALGAYLFYVQHNFPAVDLGDQSEWDYIFAAMHSSSFLDTNRLMHWFTGNIGYHHIHHLNARIPFYRLPEVMKALPELQSPGRTSLSPRQIFACCRLKLWDAQKGVMVGYNGR